MRFVLFDVDGTLIRGDGDGRLCMERAFAEVFELAEVPEVAGRVRFDGCLDARILESMAEVVGIGRQRLAERLDRLIESYLAHLREQVATHSTAVVLPGVESLLTLLSERSDIALGLLTGNLEAGARVKLAPHGLNRFFATGGFGDDGQTRAEVARVAVGRLEQRCRAKILPSSVFVVGDSCRDVECGRDNGFITVAVDTGWTSRATLQAAAPDHLLADLADLDRCLRILGLSE